MAVQKDESIPHEAARLEPGAPATSANSEAGVAKAQPRPSRYIMRINMIVLVLVLMASGLVPLRDVLFAIFASVYFIAFGKLVYPSLTKIKQPRVIPTSRLFESYIAFAGLVALLIPVAYILGSFVYGDQVAMKSAAPHLFLVACQVLTEITVNGLPTAPSLPLVALVPIFYNTRRLFTMAAWLETEFSRTPEDSVGEPWILFGRGLAAANMALWIFNLLGFLIPVYLPLVMKRHYELELKLSKEHQK